MNSCSSRGGRQWYNILFKDVFLCCLHNLFLEVLLKHILSAGFLLTSASFSLSAIAYTSADTQTATEIPAVLVSGARTEQSTLTTPSSVTVIARQEIQQSGAEHVVDVLRNYGGISVVDSYGDGSRATVSMRGFSGSSANANTLILIDGRRLNNTDTSSPELNSVSLQDVQRIEIVQGSAGVLFGDQAVGGVINIITDGSGGEVGSIEASAGSYNKAGLRVVYGDDVNENMNYRLSADIKQSDNYRPDNNELEYMNLFAKTGINYSDGNVFAEVQHIKEDLQLPGSLLASELEVDRRQTYADFLSDYANSETDVIRLGVNHNVSDNWSIEAEATYRDVERDIQQSFRGLIISEPRKLKRKQIELTPRLIAFFPTKNGDVQVTAGIDLIDTDFDSEITFSADDQLMLAEYIQVVVPVDGKLNVTAGFRHAKVEDDVTSALVNGKQSEEVDVAEFGLAYNVSNEVKLFGRLDQNFRFAKVDELTYVSPGTQLKPQTGDSVEAGIEYSKDSSVSKIVVYRLSLEDEIAFDSSATPPVGAPFSGANVNFDPTTHQGIILESRYDFGWEISLSGSYSYTDATFDSGVFADKEISGVAKNNARVNLNYLVNESIGINLGGVYVGSHYLDGDNANAQTKVSGYSVLNTNLSYSYNDWRVAFKVNNVTNRKYFENANSFGSRYPLPERNFLLTAAWNFR